MARVVVQNNFRWFTKRLEQEQMAALNAAAEAAAAVARSTQSPYQIAEILNSIEVLPARRSRRGFTAVVIARDWRAWFFETGTYAKKGALKRRSRRSSASTSSADPRAGMRVVPAGGHRGVKPVRFMRKGYLVGRRVLIFESKRRVGVR